MNTLSPFYTQVVTKDLPGRIWTLAYRAPLSTSFSAPSVSAPGGYMQTIDTATDLSYDYTDWIPCRELDVNDSFYGLNRNIDRIRMAGQYLAISKERRAYLLDCCQTAIGLCMREGGEPDIGLLASDVYKELVNCLGALRILKPGVSNMSILGISCIEDPTLRSGTGYFLTSSSWSLCRDPVSHHAVLICSGPYKNIAVLFSPFGSMASPPAYKPPVCECGAVKVGSSHHSHWCPIK